MPYSMAAAQLLSRTTPFLADFRACAVLVCKVEIHCCHVLFCFIARTQQQGRLCTGGTGVSCSFCFLFSLDCRENCHSYGLIIIYYKPLYGKRNSFGRKPEFVWTRPEKRSTLSEGLPASHILTRCAKKAGPFGPAFLKRYTVNPKCIRFLGRGLKIWAAPRKTGQRVRNPGSLENTVGLVIVVGSSSLFSAVTIDRYQVLVYPQF